MSFNMIDFIEKKRDGGRHTKAEFDALIRGVMDGSVPDYQTAAWLMAVCSYQAVLAPLGSRW